MRRADAEALRLLGEGETYGKDLVRRGRWLFRWNVYGVLHRLEQRGLVRSVEEGPPAWPGGPRRRRYELTEEAPT